MSIKNITLIGSGNVAHHLGIRLQECGLNIVEVYSRTAGNAAVLANQLNVKKTVKSADIERNSDLYILAISDDAIEKVALQLSKILPAKSHVVHTSGVTSSSVFEGKFQHYGVFYPLQSFSKSKAADFQQIPICVDASNSILQEKLKALAYKISPKVYEITDEQRAYLHLAAVYANNFTNYLFHVAHQILEQQKIPFELVQPLILETAQKVQENAPSLMQTGPAVRGDEVSIQKHLKLLKKNEEWKQIYQLLSKQIEEEMK
ncbi:MAG: Rossmann-like and DUF2520 domain-containing protein [Bacteroidota bacterium]